MYLQSRQNYLTAEGRYAELFAKNKIKPGMNQEIQEIVMRYVQRTSTAPRQI